MIYLIKREIAKNLELYLALLNVPVAIYITIIFLRQYFVLTPSLTMGVLIA